MKSPIYREMTSRAPSRQDGETQSGAGRRGRRQDDREGPADRPYRHAARASRRPLSVWRCACSAAAGASASCSSSRARGIPASATRCRTFGDQVVWHTMGEGFTWETQDRARDIAAAERAWAKARELMARPDIRLIILDELNIALRYDYLPLDDGLRRACRAPAGSACRRHRTQRQAGADRRRRSRHRDDAGQASLRRRREGAARHRVLIACRRARSCFRAPARTWANR